MLDHKVGDVSRIMLRDREMFLLLEEMLAGKIKMFLFLWEVCGTVVNVPVTGAAGQLRECEIFKLLGRWWEIVGNALLLGNVVGNKRKCFCYKEKCWKTETNLSPAEEDARSLSFCYWRNC